MLTTHIMRFVVGLIPCALLVLFIGLVPNALEIFSICVIVILLIVFVYMVGIFIEWILEMCDY